MRLRMAKHWRRSTGAVCRRRSDSEWEHFRVRAWGYWLQYLGPCREFHLDGDMPSMSQQIEEDEDTCCCGDEDCPGDCIWAEEDD